MLGDIPYTLIGANSYYLVDYAMNFTYDDDGNEIHNSRKYVLEILDKAQSLNINVIRTWGNMMGGGCEDYAAHPACWDREPYGGRWNLMEVNTPGNYSEEMFEAFDWVDYEASKRDIRIMPVLINNWNEYGGMRWYIQQSPTTSKTYANVSDSGNDNWWTFHDQFYTDANVKQYYKNYMTYFLNRTNIYTGVKYKDDPAIFAIMLANEPRAKTQGANPALMKAWATEMIDHVKSIDTNHLVTIGVEGIGLNESWGDGYNMIDIHNGTGADFATFASHPEYWDWFVQRSA
jgi:mannan endo-1,4-beta-mannosidase